MKGFNRGYQNSIADSVAKAIIDHLKMIEVGNGHSQTLLVALGPIDFTRQDIHDCATVINTRQSIIHRQVFHLFTGLDQFGLQFEIAHTNADARTQFIFVKGLLHKIGTTVFKRTHNFRSRILGRHKNNIRGKIRLQITQLTAYFQAIQFRHFPIQQQ